MTAERRAGHVTHPNRRDRTARACAQAATSNAAFAQFLVVAAGIVIPGPVGTLFCYAGPKDCFSAFPHSSPFFSPYVVRVARESVLAV